MHVLLIDLLTFMQFIIFNILRTINKFAFKEYLHLNLTDYAH